MAADRWGSFRGFEISFSTPQQPRQITAFVDPVSTRPIFIDSRTVNS